MHYIEHRLATREKSDVINKQKGLLDSIKQICEKPIINFIPIPDHFPSELLPVYQSSTFTIKNFSQLQQKVDPVYSSSLDIDGLTWRLKVYPNGNGTVRGVYLSVFLELTNGLNSSSKYDYRIEMIEQLNSNPEKNIIREFSSNFEVGECWGYNRFFLLETLRSEGFILNETLILRFEVRSPSYEQKSRDQQWYIKQLETENEYLNNEIKNLRDKIDSTARDLDDDDEYTTLAVRRFS